MREALGPGSEGTNMRWGIGLGSIALGLGLATIAPAAQGPEDRAQARLRVEERLTALDEQQAETQAEDLVGEAQLALARQCLDLARRALKRHNVRSAREWADQAEQALVRVAPPEAPTEEPPTPARPAELAEPASEEVQR